MDSRRVPEISAYGDMSVSTLSKSKSLIAYIPARAEIGSRSGFAHGMDVAIKGMVVPSQLGLGTRESYELLD
jgi:hypothetical protein